ncbi:hypothetical protein ACSQ67_005554 [Phaseolus vulgaris]
MVSLSSSSNHSISQEVADEKPIPHDQNVLQKHVEFFDRNHDGIIYPWETFQGFRAIGCGYLISSVAALFINASLSRKTRPGKFPSLLFPIEVKNIQKAKHGSDSSVYDTEGRLGSFSEWKFLYILCKDRDGLLHRDTIRGVYDGSLFEKLEKEHSQKKNK